MADQERKHGVGGVAAPINVSETNVGALSITGPRNRIRAEKEAMHEALRDITNVIEVKY